MKDAIRERLTSGGVRALVCAAACGADLLALSVASDLGLRRRIVLPFAVEVFRAGSVVDRPGAYPWGELYDRFVQEARSGGDLILLGFDPHDPSVYERTNGGILDEALSMAAETHDEAEAIVVWDEERRSGHDFTGHFASEARLRSMQVTPIAILG